ncbi:MAG: zinc-ribbon domain-containing protein, partial [Clostridia bacterium]|nr:zinc-ribbon domain-containing protein [Clostridia bacterium]
MKKPAQTVSEVDWLLKEWDFDANSKLGLSPDTIGSQSNKTACWKCRFGHTWTAKINNRYNGCGCPECRKGLKTSFPEQAVFFYLKSIFPDAVNSYKDIFSSQMELDIFLPSINVGIEYDGIAWHGENAVEKEQRKHEICKQNNIHLVRLIENKKHVSSELLIADSTVFVSTPFSGNNASYRALDDAITKLLQELSSKHPFNGNGEKSKGAITTTYSNLTVNTFKDRILILQNYLAIKEDNSFGKAYPEIAQLWHPTKNGFLTPYMFPPHTNTIVWWHGKCGHEWENPITVMSRGYGCPYCHGLRVLKGFNDLESVYPEIAKQWHPTKNGQNKPDMFTFGSGHKAYWLCPICNKEWLSAINNRTTNHHNCPFCSHEKPIKGINDLATVRPDLMAEWNYDKNVGLDPSNYMEFSNKKVWWKC